MKDSVHLGMNKTGTQMSPILTKEMQAGMDELMQSNLDTSVKPGDLRQMYIKESGQVGSVPIPASVKGVMNTALQKIKGDHPEVLMDKLGERLAFERSGVRLYDALLIKCETLTPNANVDILREFRDEEAKHFFMLQDTIEKLGGDPTAQTPCADVAGVASMGLMQVLNDPRTTVPQCVEAILIAELTDNDAWDMLIHLAHEDGLTEEVEKFQQAKVEEEKHLIHIRRWLQDLVSSNESVTIQ